MKYYYSSWHPSTFMHLAVGIMLTSCVSGAQLSNYATFLTDPQMAPLSIVMTSISTATAVFVTPFLSLLLIGKKLPVDVKGMVSNILQIVVTPIATGLLLNRYIATFTFTATKTTPWFIRITNDFITTENLKSNVGLSDFFFSLSCFLRVSFVN